MVSEILTRFKPLPFLLSLVRIYVAESFDAIFRIFDDFERDYFLLFNVKSLVDKRQLVLGLAYALRFVVTFCLAFPLVHVVAGQLRDTDQLELVQKCRETFRLRRNKLLCLFGFLGLHIEPVGLVVGRAAEYVEHFELEIVPVDPR